MLSFRSDHIQMRNTYTGDYLQTNNFDRKSFSISSSSTRILVNESHHTSQNQLSSSVIFISIFNLQMDQKIMEKQQKMVNDKEQENNKNKTQIIKDQQVNQISAEQLRELKMMFDYFDNDQSGALDTQELKKLIEMIMGSQATEEQRLDLLAEVDQDGNGNIEYQEFETLFKKKLMRTNFQKQMQLAFKLIDITESSYISLEQLQRICLQLNMNFTSEDIKKMMEKGSEADPGPGKVREKGKVFYQQFVKMMSQN